MKPTEKRKRERRRRRTRRNDEYGEDRIG